jgi:hypothetical protein
MIRALAMCAVVGAVVSMASCVGVNGSTENKVQPTAGQQLIDLKTALDRGAITQAEYDRKKAQILAEK